MYRVTRWRSSAFGAADICSGVAGVRARRSAVLACYARRVGSIRTRSARRTFGRRRRETFGRRLRIHDDARTSVGTPVAQIVSPVAQIVSPVTQIGTPVAQIGTPVAQIGTPSFRSAPPSFRSARCLPARTNASESRANASMRARAERKSEDASVVDGGAFGFVFAAHSSSSSSRRAFAGDVATRMGDVATHLVSAAASATAAASASAAASSARS